ncbi:phage tail assembly chaperone [Paenibacillus sp. 32O-W]|uniref:phage tail assembly chaperone n=1 Tax=Paenibacillus sp. 32O-W TaxID=1695218 RepID=UPI00119F5E26|nr:hypothetical protein [Paenibacillus sp. 32O-W]
MAKMTVKDLLAKKDQLKQKKARTQTLYVESLDAEIVIQEPSRSVALEALSMVHDDEKSEMADIHVVYNCVIEPNLKEPELQKAFGCAEPTDIVSMVFRAGEISSISGHALQLAGYSKGVRAIDKELKN